MFAVLVPLKRPERAKTRLAQSGVEDHQRLAVAFAWDTIAAAAASPMVAGVWVVTDAADLVPKGAHHLADQGSGDLNRALSCAADAVQNQHPSWGIVALCADLPALRTEDLTAALQSCQQRCFVADAAGTGTTLLATPPGVPLSPAFGEGSAARHEANGATPLAAALPTLRLDVDTADDLARAVNAGVGQHTATVTESLQKRP